MAYKIEWQADADQKLQFMRAQGQTWHAIAGELRVGRSAVIEQARRLGIPPCPVAAPPKPILPRADRSSMPPGHPLSWDAITAGTALHGEPYPYPVFL